MLKFDQRSRSWPHRKRSCCISGDPYRRPEQRRAFRLFLRWGHLTWPSDLTLSELGLKFSQNMQNKVRMNRCVKNLKGNQTQRGTARVNDQPTIALSVRIVSHLMLSRTRALAHIHTSELSIDSIFASSRLLRAARHALPGGTCQGDPASRLAQQICYPQVTKAAERRLAWQRDKHPGSRVGFTAKFVPWRCPNFH